MSATTEAWAGSWGSSYTARNRVDWCLRIPFWADVLDLTGARSVYEVGTNAGFNLTAIKYADPLAQVYGCEVNGRAYRQAKAAGFVGLHNAPALEVLPFFDEEFDLVFTAGVLIHVPPAELNPTMEAIVKASADYVLAVEYHAEREEEVLYRGQSGMLWRRPYGKLYEAMGLQLVKEWDAGSAFDRCQAWLLRRRAA